MYYDIYCTILRKVFGEDAIPVRNSQFLNRLKKENGTYDKIVFAIEYTSSMEKCDMSNLNLDEDISRLVSFITASNS